MEQDTLAGDGGERGVGAGEDDVSPGAMSAETAAAITALRRRLGLSQREVEVAAGLQRDQLSRMLKRNRPTTPAALRALAAALQVPIGLLLDPPPADLLLGGTRGAGGSAGTGTSGTGSAWLDVASAAPTPTTELAREHGVALHPLPVYRANEPLPVAPPLTAWPPLELVVRLAGGFGVQVTADALAGYRLPNGTRLERGDLVWCSTVDLEHGWLRAGAGQLVAALVDFPERPGEPGGQRLVLRVYAGTPAAPRLALQPSPEAGPREADTQEHTLLGVAIYVVRGYALNGTPVPVPGTPPAAPPGALRRG